jgi:hypothetical protein
VESQNLFSRHDLEPLLALPRMEEVQAMPLPRALAAMVALDLRRMWRFRQLRRRSGSRLAASSELMRALEVVRRQASVSRDILFLGKMQQVFHLWHVVHRPFSYSFALLSLLHVAVVTLLGYY